jgi:hypothetical protein
LRDPWLLIFVVEAIFAELPLFPEELTLVVVALDCFTEKVYELPVAEPLLPEDTVTYEDDPF